MRDHGFEVEMVLGVQRGSCAVMVLCGKGRLCEVENSFWPHHHLISLYRHLAQHVGSLTRKSKCPSTTGAWWYEYSLKVVSADRTVHARVGLVGLVGLWDARPRRSSPELQSFRASQRTAVDEGFEESLRMRIWRGRKWLRVEGDSHVQTYPTTTFASKTWNIHRLLHDVLASLFYDCSE